MITNYQKNIEATADDSQTIIMIYSRINHNLELMIKALENDNHEERYNIQQKLLKAIDCLRLTMSDEKLPSVAQALDMFYSGCYQKLAFLNVTDKEQAVADLEELMDGFNNVKTAWQQDNVMASPEDARLNTNNLSV